MEAFVNTSQSIKHNGGGNFQTAVTGTSFTTAADEFAIMTLANGGQALVGGSTFNPSEVCTVYVPPSTSVVCNSGTLIGTYVRFKNS